MNTSFSSKSLLINHYFWPKDSQSERFYCTLSNEVPFANWLLRRCHINSLGTNRIETKTESSPLSSHFARAAPHKTTNRRNTKQPKLQTQTVQGEAKRRGAFCCRAPTRTTPSDFQLNLSFRDSATSIRCVAWHPNALIVLRRATGMNQFFVVTNHTKREHPRLR